MVRVVCLSDTHNQHWKFPTLPAGDVLVHAGDFTREGTQREILDFNDWLGQQDYHYKIVVPGNHEVLFQESWFTARGLLSNANHVLNDQGVEILGKRFWGSSWTPEFCGWAFGYGQREGELRWTQIPVGLDMLITHGPPSLVFDTTFDKKTKQLKNVGCRPLRREVFERARPRFHVFGHVHQSYGLDTIDGIVCANVSQLDERYAQEVHRRPVVLDI